MDNSIHAQNLSAVEAEFQQAVDEMKTAFADIRRIERQLSASNFDELMPQLYQNRKLFLMKVREFDQALELKQGIGSKDGVEYLKFLNAETPDVSLMDNTHRLVGVRVKLIESWFLLKKCSVEHPLHLTRKKEFLDVMDQALTILKKPMEFEQMYELYADDISKLRSLVVSYFRKKDEKLFIEQFNGHAKAAFSDRNEVSLLLREFALFFDYKAIS